MHRHLLAAAAALVVLANTSASPAWALWGCGAQGPRGGWSNSAGGKTKQDAIDSALRICQANGARCHIIGCSPDVDTIAQAAAIWAPPSRVTMTCRGAKCRRQ